MGLSPRVRGALGSVGGDGRQGSIATRPAGELVHQVPKI
jgi:hypothetical protein